MKLFSYDSGGEVVHQRIIDGSPGEWQESIDDSGNWVVNASQWDMTFTADGGFEINDDRGLGFGSNGTSLQFWTNTDYKFVNLSTDGFVKTSNADGTLIIDTATYLDQTTADSNYLKVDQTTPQTVINGAPIFSNGIRTNVIEDDTYVSFNSSLGGQAYFDMVNSRLALGFGFFAPTANLHIQYPDTVGTNYPSIRVVNSGTSNPGYAAIVIASDTVGFQIATDRGGNAFGAASAMIRTTSSHPLKFAINSTERLEIDTSGALKLSPLSNRVSIGSTVAVNGNESVAVGYSLTNAGVRCALFGYSSTIPSTSSQGSVNLGTANTTSQDTGVFVNVGASNSMQYTVSALNFGYLNRMRGISGAALQVPIALGYSNNITGNNSFTVGRAVNSAFDNGWIFGYGVNGNVMGFTLDYATGNAGIDVRNPQVGFDINSNVLISNSASLGSELVTNGAFAADTNWTKGTGWTISSGNAIHAGATSGTLVPSSAITPVVGSVYEISVDVVSGTANDSNMTISFGGVTCPVFRSGDTNFVNATGYKLRVLATSTANLSIAAVGTIRIDNFSIKEVTGGDLRTLGTVRTGGYTVATLPTGAIGMRAYVTDATAPTFLGTLTGGGSVVTPVFYNGTAWVSG
jgi:hypothetical protein